MYDYGNARVAACRSRLLTPEDLLQLQESGSPSAMVGLLERRDDWRRILDEVASLSGRPAQVIDAAIERHRSHRLAALLRWYPEPVRTLVEALVMTLDVERLIEVLRRQRAGERAERIGVEVAPGALLDAQRIGVLARAPSLEDALDRASACGLMTRHDGRALGRLATGGATPETIEREVCAAIDRARLARASAPGDAAAIVRDVVTHERDLRLAAAGEIGDLGAATAALSERDAALAYFDEVARAGWRDPLGIGTIVGYVAAVEAGAIRLRAVLAGVGAGWTRGLVGEYLHVPRSRRRRSPAAA